MVNPTQLAFDIAGNLTGLAVPGGLWALLFLLAWERGPFAESLGLGSRAFWLLLPGAVLASFALLPIAPVSYDWVAVSLGGAVFPMLVGALAFRRYATPAGPRLALFVVLMVLEGATLLFLVLPGTVPTLVRDGYGVGLAAAPLTVLLVAVVAALFTSVVLALASQSRGSGSYRRVAFAFALTSWVAVFTYAGSATIPGVGIVESFPFYLLSPLFAGVVAGLCAPWVFRGEEGFALPASFLSATVGVLVGADLLRQPPLYGHGPAGLYTIGGAGVLDLVYLSGFLALGGAYVVHWLEGRGWEPLGAPLPVPERTPIATLRTARKDGAEGRVERSIRGSAGAARAAAHQARRLLDLPAPPDERPWEGLRVAGWVVSDQANLDSVARSGSLDPREAYRAWMTSRALVMVGRQLGYPRYATIPGRAVAFLIDLALVIAAAAAIFAAIVGTTRGGVDAALSSLTFNAAVYGVIAGAFFYFVFAEAWFGTTVGKSVLGLVVRDRRLEMPGALSALVRNVSLLPVLTVASLAVSITVALVVKGPATATTGLLGFGLTVDLLAILLLGVFLIGTVVFLGGFAVLAIALTWERQRVGDLWAGTWVVLRPARRPEAEARPPPAGPSS